MCFERGDKIKTVLIYGDNVHDDTEALEQILTGHADGIFPDGTIMKAGSITGGKQGYTFKISRTVIVCNNIIEEGENVSS